MCVKELFIIVSDGTTDPLVSLKMYNESGWWNFNKL